MGVHYIGCRWVLNGLPCDCGANEAADVQVASPEQQLVEWWVELAREEAIKVVPKAIEYGATDLREIGRVMRESMSYRGVHTDASDAELGVYFYLVGKVARWTDAIIAGRKVSDDTLLDIGVYVRMAQRIRQAGSWPGVDLIDKNR